MPVGQFEGLDLGGKVDVLSDEGCPVGVIEAGVGDGDWQVGGGCDGMASKNANLRARKRTGAQCTPVLFRNVRCRIGA